MGLVLASVAGLCVWIVLWSLDYKAIDAFMITVVVALVAVMVRMLVPHLPGKRRS
jgi:Mn2+/Fe2+ NRAMP family transporter